MKLLRRKTKKIKTKKMAENAMKLLAGYSLCNLDEENKKIMTEKEITGIDEMIEDKNVDSTQIHFCYHDQPAGGCKLLNIKEAKNEYKANNKKNNMEDIVKMS